MVAVWFLAPIFGCFIGSITSALSNVQKGRDIRAQLWGIWIFGFIFVVLVGIIALYAVNR